MKGWAYRGDLNTRLVQNLNYGDNFGIQTMTEIPDCFNLKTDYFDLMIRLFSRYSGLEDHLNTGHKVQ